VPAGVHYPYSARSNWPRIEFQWSAGWSAHTSSCINPRRRQREAIYKVSDATVTRAVAETFTFPESPAFLRLRTFLDDAVNPPLDSASIRVRRHDHRTPLDGLRPGRSSSATIDWSVQRDRVGANVPRLAPCRRLRCRRATYILAGASLADNYISITELLTTSASARRVAARCRLRVQLTDGNRSPLSGLV